jgi:molybdopterin-guanine dinucleotide biosynthesis protein A
MDAGASDSQTTNFISMNPVAGLILCGGRSSRMGEDKCFLQYRERPQWQYLSLMLGSVCHEVVVSCNRAQLPRLTLELPSLQHPPLLLTDLREFEGHGPMGGLLTAFQIFPGHSFLVVGCDYPFVTAEDLQALISARRKDCDVVCYSREEEERDEPLLAVYESSSLTRIMHAYCEGEYSLRKLLQEVRTMRLKASNPQRLQSIDTPEAFHLARDRMTSSH